MSNNKNGDLSEAAVKQAKELGIETPALELSENDGYATPEGDGEESMGDLTPGAEDDSKEDITPSATDESSEVADDEESDDLQNKPKYTKEQIRELAQQRQGQRRGRVNELENKVGSLESKIDKLVDAISKGGLTANQTESKVEQWAKKYNFDSEQAKELAASILEDRQEPTNQTEEESELEQPITHSLDVDDPEMEKAYFEAEWEENISDIESIYPNASNSQMIAAKKLLDEISHSSARLVQYELVDIINSPRFKSQFDDILKSPRKRGFEEGRNRESRQGDVNKFDRPINGTKAALEMEQQLFDMAKNSENTPLISPHGNVL